MTGTAHAPLPSTASSFFGHPKGLLYIALTSVAEVFAFVGIQSLMILYLVEELLQPGKAESVFGLSAFRGFIESFYGSLSDLGFASAVVGIYSAMAYLTPILGGIVSDRWTGRTPTIMFGTVAMAAGATMLVFQSTFLPALLLLLIGVGAFGNIKAQLGELYAPEDLLRTDGFQIYTIAANLAIIGCPIVCGTLAQRMGWNWAFGATAVAMLVSVFLYYHNRRWMPLDHHQRRQSDGPSPRLSAGEWRRAGILALLLPVLAAAAVGRLEVYNAYLVWARDTYDLDLFGYAMPVPWLLALDGFWGLIAVFATMLFWRRIARAGKLPNELFIMCLGAGLVTLSVLLLALISPAPGTGKISLGWAVAFHIMSSLGFANIYSFGISLFSRAAPPALAGTAVSIYALYIFAGYLAVSRIGGLLSTMSGTDFWLTHAFISGAAAVVLAAMAVTVGKMLKPS